MMEETKNPTPEEEVTEEVNTEEEVETAEAEAEEEMTKEDRKEAKKKAKADKKGDALKEKIAELEDKTMRQLAEFENFRNRTEKEKQAMFETGARSVIEKLLPVVDNF